MQITATAIPDVKLITPKKFGDERGFFSETYSKAKMTEAGFPMEFVQDNHSLSVEVGVVRGLHFQAPPFAQSKLVRCVRGEILDVAVDIRRGSPTYGQHVAIVLNADNWSQLFIPRGFAHGFATLKPNTEVLYKVDNVYAPDHDRGLSWNDPALRIDWLLGGREARLSDKDRKHPTLADFHSPFDYEAAHG